MQRNGLSEIDRTPGGERGDLRLRRLGYGDLPSVISIERRSFPTPWSLAMFVLELSKPSGICLAAEDTEGLVGYLVCARYDDVWHLMNVAVHPDRRPLPFHAGGSGLQRARDRDVSPLRLPLGGPPSPVLPRQRRGRTDHVARG